MHNRFEDVYTNELRKLRGYITEHRAEISALEEVKRIYKKDGGTFSALAKNWTGAQLRDSDSILGGRVLVIGYSYEEEQANGRTFTKWGEVKIATRSTSIEGIDPARVYRVLPYIKPCYDLTPDEIDAEILREISNRVKWCETYERRISELEEARDELAGIVSRVLDMVEDTKRPTEGDYLGNYHIADIISKSLN